MSPHPPTSKPGANPVEDDFDWPPPHDDLSVHDLDGAPWSHLQAASNEAFAHRHGEPAPPRPAPRPSRVQLGVVIAISAALTFAAAWAMREMRHPIALIAGTEPAASTLVTADEAPAPPPLTIIATYPAGPARDDRGGVGRTGADHGRVDEMPAPAAMPVPAVVAEPAALDEPRHAASSTHEVPLVTAGPAIDDAMATAALVADAVPAPAAIPTAPWSARADADIRDLLRRYEAAYDQRDVATAAALWPTLDQRALSRAFASLDRQDVSFEHCEIDASERRGSAVCVGTVRYVPRVGRGVEKEGRITWTFDLARSGEDWRITRLNAR